MKQTAEEHGEDLASRVAAGRTRILEQLRLVIVGQDEVVDQVLIALFTGGHCLLTGVPGLAKTLLIKTLASILDLTLQAHPVHARPDAGRHHRHRDPRRGRRRARAALRARADLRADPARRRDQPHAAQDPGGAARGDAGVPRHRRRPHLRARTAVLRAGDPEPDRARGHLSAARGAARSLHVQRDDVVPLGGRRGARRHPDDRQRPPQARAGAERRRHPGFHGYVRQVVVAEEVARYAVRLVDASRPGRGPKLEFVEKYVKWGAGLRASQALILGGKARALIHGRHHVVGQGHPGAGGADPAPPRAFRTSTARPRASPPTASSSGCCRPCRRRPAGCRNAMAGPDPLSRPGGAGAARHARPQGQDDRRRRAERAAPQPVPRLQRRVRRVPAVHPRRRAEHHRLEGLRPLRSPLRQEVRGGHQPRLPPAARRERLDELRLGRGHQARVRLLPGGVAGLPDAPPARRRRPHRLRRPRSSTGCRRAPAPAI